MWSAFDPLWTRRLLHDHDAVDAVLGGSSAVNDSQQHASSNAGHTQENLRQLLARLQRTTLPQAAIRREATPPPTPPQSLSSAVVANANQRHLEGDDSSNTERLPTPPPIPSLPGVCVVPIAASKPAVAAAGGGPSPLASQEGAVQEFFRFFTVWRPPPSAADRHPCADGFAPRRIANGATNMKESPDEIDFYSSDEAEAAEPPQLQPGMSLPARGIDANSYHHHRVDVSTERKAAIQRAEVGVDSFFAAATSSERKRTSSGTAAQHQFQSPSRPSNRRVDTLLDVADARHSNRARDSATFGNNALEKRNGAASYDLLANFAMAPAISHSMSIDVLLDAPTATQDAVTSVREGAAARQRRGTRGQHPLLYRVIDAGECQLESWLKATCQARLFAVVKIHIMRRLCGGVTLACATLEDPCARLESVPGLSTRGEPLGLLMPTDVLDALGSTLLNVRIRLGAPVCVLPAKASLGLMIPPLVVTGAMISLDEPPPRPEAVALPVPLVSRGAAAPFGVPSGACGDSGGASALPEGPGPLWGVKLSSINNALQQLRVD